MDSHDSDSTGGQDYSPNIKNLAEEQDRLAREAADAKKAAQKAQETVAIDGVAFSDDEIDYRSKDIRRKDFRRLFTNVEGAEQRARQAERDRKTAQDEAIRRAIKERDQREDAVETLREFTSEQEIAAKRKARRAQLEQIKAASNERERTKKELAAANRRESENLKHEKALLRQEQAELRRQTNRSRRQKIVNALWSGKRRTVTIVIVCILLIAVTLLILWLTIWRPAMLAERERIEEHEEAVASFEEAQDVAAEAQRIYDEEFANNGFERACKLFTDAIANAQNARRRIDLTFDYVQFLTENSNRYQDAITALDQIAGDIESLPSVKYRYHATRAQLFDKLGDWENLGIEHELMIEAQREADEAECEKGGCDENASSMQE